MTETAVVNTVNTTQAEFSVKTHFTQAWEIFKATALRMFLFQLITGTVVVVWSVILAISFIFLTLSSVAVRTAAQAMSHGDMTAFLNIPGSFWQTLIILLVVMMAIFILILMPFASSGLILAVSDTEKKYSFGQLVTKSLRLIPGVAVFLLISFVINFGTMWLFVIPSLIIGFFLSFGIYEVILEKKNALDAMRSSLALVEHDFWLVVGRSLLLGVMIVVIFNVMPGVLSSIDNSLGSLYRVISFIPSVCAGWFSIAYTFTLYKQLKRTTPKNKSAGIWWILLLSALGWLIALAVFVGLIKLAQSPTIQQAIKDELASKQKEATSSAQFNTDYDIETDYQYALPDDLQPTFVPKQPTGYPTMRVNNR